VIAGSFYSDFDVQDEEDNQLVVALLDLEHLL
jgi:hypothetical protein